MRTLAMAYAVVWAVIFGYLVMQYFRISKAEREIENLRKALKEKNIIS